MTTQQTADLKSKLETMFAQITNRENILNTLEKIEQIRIEIGRSAPPQLRHFLENRSYQKALDFINFGFANEDPDQRR